MSREHYEQGLACGRQVATLSSGASFAGTSIVIPTFNQIHFLKQCLTSIFTYTDTPYEVIVVDNGSQADTRSYLQRLSMLGRIRYVRLTHNRGFAGATNVGLMQARGQTICLLNNDTVVTRGWLRHLLGCLRADSSTGMVGPCTNYIYGAQMIHGVPYKTIRGMHNFATKFRQRAQQQNEAMRWPQANLLIGYCLVFRRELFQRVGYLDEQFAIGNYEDDDYCMRVRALGLKLRIARDVFIHHYGSKTMGQLSKQKRSQVNRANQAMFARKWQHAHLLDEKIRGQHELDLYPANVFVRVPSREEIWFIGQQGEQLGDKIRHRVIEWNEADMQKQHVVQIPWHHLNQIVQGEDYIMAQAREEQSRQRVVIDREQIYIVEANTLRAPVSEYARECWGLTTMRQPSPISEQEAQLPHGIPIIAPAYTQESPLPKLRMKAKRGSGRIHYKLGYAHGYELGHNEEYFN